MCGIVGLYYSNYCPGFMENTIQAMLNSLVHRGPDSEGALLANPIALGVRRLSIVDRDGADQPLHNETGDIYLVFNGEIYNYKALRSLLSQRGHSFYTKGDGEVIVHAYEEFGEECVNFLEGMFAFAVWDSRQQVLLIARDRFGEKPLFYTQLDKSFAFASELPALLCNPDIQRDLDYFALSLYLSLSYIPAPSTAYANVFKLLPGHLLLWHNERLICKPYWHPEFTPKCKHNFEQAVTEVARKLSQSVGLRLDSDVSVGAFLSGGIDSSLVVAMAQQNCDTPLQTFSVGFEDEPKHDEREYAHRVSSFLGTHHHHILLGPPTIEEIEKIYGLYGEPFADASAIPTYYLARSARERVGVVITGDGGDELFAGYSRYTHVMKSSDPLSLNAEIKTILDDRTLTQACSVGLLEKRLTGSLADGLSEYADYSVLDQVMLLDLRTYLPDSVLFKVDIATMAQSLEARSPFLDRELAEYAMKLPDRYKVFDNRTKITLRAMGENFLPEVIVNREKQGFSVPLQTWLRALKPYVFDLLCDGSVQLHEFISSGRLNTLICDHYRGARDSSRQLWVLLVLEMWLKRHKQLAC